jgi:type I restriction enzyme R subunit
VRRMIEFAEAYPDREIVVSLLRQLGWTHFLRLIPIDDPLKRDFYAEMSRVDNWSTRTLQQKIQSMLFERTALSKKRMDSRFQTKLTDLEQRKAFVYLLARLVKAFHFLTCFCTYAPEIEEFATFAEYVGPQLIKAGSVSDLMKQIRQTETTRVAVQYQGEVRSGGPVKLKPGKGTKGSGPPPKKVSVQDMIDEIRAKFDISDEEALYIKQVTEEKSADPVIRSTVTAHWEDRVYLEGAYREQVNGEIQSAYDERGRYEELSDLKYTDTGGIFDIMAVTVIEHHLSFAA